jgi:stage V sporulation protein B
MATPPTEALRVRLVRGGYFGLLGTVVTVLGNFTISVILARFLGSEGLGIYTIYALLGLVFVPLLTLAVPRAVTKFAAEMRGRDTDRLASLLSTAFAILIASGVAGAVILYTIIAPLAGAGYGEADLVPMLSILAFSIVFNMITLFAHSLLQGLEEFAFASLVGASAVLTNVILLLFLLGPFGLVGAAAAAAGAVVVNAGIGAFAVSRAMRRHGLPWRWHVHSREARTLVVFAGPLNASAILARLSTLFQNSLIALEVSFAELGLIRVATVFQNAILFLPRTLLAPMLPLLSSMAATRTDERQREIVTQLVKLALLLLLPMAVGLLLALPFVVELVYGLEFMDAVPFAVVFILVGVFAVPNVLLGEQYLIAKGRTTVVLYITVYAATTALLLTIALLGPFGAMALPIAALVVETSVFFALLVYTQRRGELAIQGIIPALSLVIVATAGATAGGALLAESAVYLALPAALAVLPIEYFLFMTEGERTLLRNTVRRRRR